MSYFARWWRSQIWVELEFEVVEIIDDGRVTVGETLGLGGRRCESMRVVFNNVFRRRWQGSS